MSGRYYPFDYQSCSIKIGSWQYDISRINLEANIINDNFEEYLPNQNWELVNLTISTEATGTRDHQQLSDDSANKETMNEDLLLIMIIKRKPLYYMINNIYPSLVLNIVALVSFALPFASQVTLCMSVFLTLAVYSVRVAGDMPAESDSLPWISLYFILEIFFTLISELSYS